VSPIYWVLAIAATIGGAKVLYYCVWIVLAWNIAKGFRYGRANWGKDPKKSAGPGIDNWG
jgi:hypothetical protein